MSNSLSAKALLGVFDRAINGSASTASTLKFSSAAGGNIDAALGIISGVSVITSGVQAVGHAVYIDDETLRQVQTCSEKFGASGVRVKMNHGSGFAAIVGTLKNFRIDTETTGGAARLRADLHLLRTHAAFPTICEMAQKCPTAFGLSISFSGVKQDVEGLDYARCSELYSVDLVDMPAANPNGLFSKPTNPLPIMNTPQKSKTPSLGRQIGEPAGEMLFHLCELLFGRLYGNPESLCAGLSQDASNYENCRRVFFQNHVAVPELSFDQCLNRGTKRVNFPVSLSEISRIENAESFAKGFLAEAGGADTTTREFTHSACRDGANAAKKFLLHLEWVERDKNAQLLAAKERLAKSQQAFNAAAAEAERAVLSRFSSR